MKESILQMYFKWLSAQPYPDELSRESYILDYAFTNIILTLDKQGY